MIAWLLELPLLSLCTALTLNLKLLQLSPVCCPACWLSLSSIKKCTVMMLLWSNTALRTKDRSATAEYTDHHSFIRQGAISKWWYGWGCYQQFHSNCSHRAMSGVLMDAMMPLATTPPSYLKHMQEDYTKVPPAPKSQKLASNLKITGRMSGICVLHQKADILPSARTTHCTRKPLNAENDWNIESTDVWQPCTWLGRPWRQLAGFKQSSARMHRPYSTHKHRIWTDPSSGNHGYQAWYFYYR